jgi:hypothetical protein
MSFKPMLELVLMIMKHFLFVLLFSLITLISNNKVESFQHLM